jgi:hypothetical protein
MKTSYNVLLPLLFLLLIRAKVVCPMLGLLGAEWCAVVEASDKRNTVTEL